METHIMLDLETLGTAPGSVILSIGAVHFGRGEIHDVFHQHVRVGSSVSEGLQMDGATVLWWLGQSDAARAALLDGQKKSSELTQVLSELFQWCAGKVDDEFQHLCIWGNGASFDCAVLAAAYRACHLPLPWKYSGERCYRTVKALHPEVPEESREGIHHNALDDAKHQARHLMKLLPTL